MPFAERGGRQDGWPRCWPSPVACAPTTITSAACCLRPAGADRTPSPGPVPAPKRPSSRGRQSGGPRAKKADEDKVPSVWGDEAGGDRLPMVVPTGAPGGQRPLLRLKLPSLPDTFWN
jgi:hypothetical protein